MPPCQPGVPDPTTSVRVRDAIAGDRESLGWIVTRFSPLRQIVPDSLLDDFPAE